MKREQYDLTPLVLMLIQIQGCLKGSQVETGNYAFENFRQRCLRAYCLGHNAATEMLNEVGIDKPTPEMETLAKKAQEIHHELYMVISALSPLVQKHGDKMIEDVENGELIYFGDIVANPRPDWFLKGKPND